MNETAKITFYRIKNCGFYRRANQVPEFGSIEQLLEDLSTWSAGKEMVATKVFEPEEGSDLLPVYLYDIKQSKGSYVLTTWNQTPSTEAGVASVAARSVVGGAHVVMNDIEKDSIPGFATYFWFPAGSAYFATVRFQHLQTAQRALQGYLDQFQANWSRYTVYGEDENGVVVPIGYREHARDEPKKLIPKFSTSLFLKPGEHEYMVENAEKIRKLHRKTTLELGRQNDKDWWQKLLTWSHLAKPQNQPDQVRVRYEMPAELDKNAVSNIIEDWRKEPARQWDDYGFQFVGEQQPRWLSHSMAREEFDLEVTRENPEVISCDSLLRALTASSKKILKILE